MKRSLAGVIGGMILLSLGGSRAAAQSTNLPTLIVAPFSGDQTMIPYWQPAMGQDLSEMLATELDRINKFHVVANSELSELKNDFNLDEDGWVQVPEKVDQGGYGGTDFLFMARVSRFGSKESRVGLGGFVPGNLGRLGVRQTVWDVRIDWRVVDMAARKVIKEGSAMADRKGRGYDVGANVDGSGDGIDLNNMAFADSALGQATVAALAQITAELEKLTLPERGWTKPNTAFSSQATAAHALKGASGKVLAVTGEGTVIVSLGSQQGFKEGDKLNLYQTTDVRDEQGNIMFTVEKLVGEITLQSVQENQSRAAYSGDLAVRQGWTVKAR